jgi:hypothetical protein
MATRGRAWLSQQFNLVISMMKDGVGYYPTKIMPSSASSGSRPR